MLAASVLTACQSRPSVAAPESGVVARIPRDAARFEIEVVDDSTAVIRLEEARWVRRGLAAYAVDPQRRDALVARLSVIALDSTTARLLVTSQVTRVTTEHFLLVPRPVTPWWRSRVVWTSMVAGALAGISGTLLVR